MSEIVRWSGDEDAWARIIERARAASARGGAVGLAAERAPSRAQLSEAVAAGVTEVALWLHGARREVHDWHAGEGAFEATHRAIDALRAHGRSTAIASLVTRSSARVLSELPSMSKASGVALWVLAWPRAIDEATFTATVPRVGLGVPAALAALDRAERLGLEARIAGAPRCALGPFAARSLASDPRGYGARCEGCAARDGCAGLDLAYLRRFGDRELRRLDEAVPSAPVTSLASLALSLITPQVNRD